MGLGALNYQGVKGGLKLNDVIEEFKYVYKDKTIKAGDFVNYIKGVGSKTIEGTNTSNTIPSAYFDSASAVVLDENRVFLASGKKGVSGGKLNCVVLSINGAEIIVNTVYSYATTSSPTDISATLLDTNKVVISMREGDVATAIVAGITNTTIGLGSSYKIGTGDSSYYDIDTQIVALSTTTALMCWNRYRNSTNNTYGLRACILTIGSGASKVITAGTTLSVRVSIHEELTLSKLNDTTAFLTSLYSTSKYGEIQLFNIDGTTVSNSMKQFTTSSETGSISSLKNTAINENTVLISYFHSNSATVRLVTVDASAKKFTFGTIFTAISGYSISSLLLIDTNKVLISYGSRNFLVAEIIGDTITFHEDGLYSLVETNVNYLTTAKIKNGKVIAVYQNLEQANKYDYDNYGTSALLGIDGTQVSNVIASIEYEQQVTLATEPPFDGIALSNGVGGDDTGHNEQVKIAKAKTNLVKNGDFSRGLENWSVYSDNVVDYSLITENGENIFKFKGITATSNRNVLKQILYLNTTHIYYGCAWVRGDVSNDSVNNNFMNFSATSFGTVNTTSANTTQSWQKIAIYGTPSIVPWNLDISFLMRNDNYNYVKNVVMYDLTEMFGAGNEPNKIWCQNNL